jgi:hypothetical protein
MAAISAYILITTTFPSTKRKRIRKYFKWTVKVEIRSRLENPRKRTKAIMNAVIAGEFHNLLARMSENSERKATKR